MIVQVTQNFIIHFSILLVICFHIVLSAIFHVTRIFSIYIVLTWFSTKFRFVNLLKCSVNEISSNTNTQSLTMPLPLWLIPADGDQVIPIWFSNLTRSFRSWPEVGWPFHSDYTRWQLTYHQWCLVKLIFSLENKYLLPVFSV